MQCAETYRGPTSFSEPETQAVRALIEKEKTISSAMNFHCYGNIWIHPFNYMHTPHKYPINAYKDIINFYEEFKYEVAKVSKASYGNAIETVEYSTDGEGSDWMLGEHKIVAFSPELGSSNIHARTFFLPKDLIHEVIQENYKVIELFMKRNNFEIKDLVYGVNNRNEFTLSFTNRGLANIFAARLVFKSMNTDFLKGITHVNIQSEEGEVTKIDFPEDNDISLNGLVFEVPKINRLKELSLHFQVSDPSLLKNTIDLEAEVFMADGSLIAKFSVLFEYERFGGSFTQTLLVLVSVFCIMLMLFSWRLLKLSKQKAALKVTTDVTKPVEVQSA